MFADLYPAEGQPALSPVDYAGFNFSVLSEYRARLVTHKAEARVFEGTVQCLGNQQTISQLSADGSWHFKCAPGARCGRVAVAGKAGAP